MTTITNRISGSITADATKRVATSGEVSEIPPVFSNDTWGGTWGSTWGLTWYNATALVPATEESPAADVTRRVGAAASGGITKRVTGI